MPRHTTLLVLAFSTLLTGLATAQPWQRPIAPPSGPVEQAQPGPAQDRMGGARHARRITPELRAQLIARFDRNGDGRLTGPERRHAKHFVRKLRKQARRGGGGAGRAR